jgi:hypothetical protein
MTNQTLSNIPFVSAVPDGSKKLRKELALELAAKECESIRRSE